jgi:hypothetical protein
MNPQEIEAQIRDLLKTEYNRWTLSEKLFSPNGLFAQLGPTREDRIRIGSSPLFKEAQNRIRDLEYGIADKLRLALNSRKPKL